MPKTLLNEEKVSKLILANKYPVDDASRFHSRCIDGRYQRHENLPALSIPGADLGELAVILAAKNVYGLSISNEKAFSALVDVVGGFSNLSFHTDSHSSKEKVCAGCGHMREISKDPSSFNLINEDVEFIFKCANQAKKKGAKEVVLQGEHEEGAVVMVKGQFGIYNQHVDEEGLNEVFVFQSTLVDERHRALVKLLSSKDHDHTHLALSETVENHLFEIAKRLAIGLPIYAVNFDESGSFDLDFQGNVV